ncbi:hypothetical protein BGZ79_000563 [Entomortierella chlamydospora]|nr:hypothetical protein BGZ79_000563 [Entomortierella chlamydospora]
MSSPNQNYIRIEEDIVSEPSTPRVVQLRNVAYSHPLSSSPGFVSRSQALESLMPLSRAPWSNVSTLLDDTVQEKRPPTAFKEGSATPSSSSSSTNSQN